jgi:hypothetical protein
MSNNTSFDEVPVVNVSKSKAAKAATFVEAELPSEPGVETPAAPAVEPTGVVEAKPKWTKEELYAVFDTLLFQGEYTETTTIKGKLPITLRSRSAEETLKISREIDNTPYNLVSTVQEHKAMLNLSYSLVNYSGKELSALGQEATYKFINKLPIFIVSILIDTLANFDSKVEMACREGEENF